MRGETMRVERQTSAVWYFVGGALAGAAAALLFAPVSGEEARGEIGDWSRRGRDRANDILYKLGRSIPNRVKFGAAVGAVRGGARSAGAELRERAEESFGS